MRTLFLGGKTALIIALSFFWLRPFAQTVTSYAPSSGDSGTVVTITGTNLAGATAVYFGGTPAVSFTVVSPTEVTATVGLGATGYVRVIVPGGYGLDSLSTFSYTGYTPPPPSTAFKLSAFTAYLSGGSVYFSWQTSNSQSIADYYVEHSTDGTDYSKLDTILSESTFGGYAYKSDSVSIGNNYYRLAIADTAGNMTFGNLVQIYVPATFASWPVINAFTPQMGDSGTAVTIRGLRLDSALSVTFGGTPATSYTVVSDTEIIAIVCSGSTGMISVANTYGADTALAAGPFQYLAIHPDSVFRFTSFTESFTNERLYLNFATANEELITEYKVEHSTDSLNYAVISSINSLEQLGGGYGLVTDSFSAGNNYYRVEAVQNDNSVSFSNVLTIYIAPNASQKINAYPDPASGVVNTVVPSIPVTATLELINMQGTVVKKTAVPPGSSQAPLDLSGLPTGIYFVLWTDGSTKISKHIMVVGN